MTIKDQLNSAIDNHFCIEFFYENEPNERVANPYHYGIYGKKDHLHAFQTSGHRGSGKPQGWKNFELAKISNLKIKSQKFTPPDSGYNPSTPNYLTEHKIQYRNT